MKKVQAEIMIDGLKARGFKKVFSCNIEELLKSLENYRLRRPGEDVEEELIKELDKIIDKEGIDIGDMGHPEMLEVARVFDIDLPKDGIYTDTRSLRKHISDWVLNNLDDGFLHEKRKDELLEMLKVIKVSPSEKTKNLPLKKLRSYVEDYLEDFAIMECRDEEDESTPDLDSMNRKELINFAKENDMQISSVPLTTDELRDTIENILDDWEEDDDEWDDDELDVEEMDREELYDYVREMGFSVTSLHKKSSLKKLRRLVANLDRGQSIKVKEGKKGKKAKIEIPESMEVWSNGNHVNIFLFGKTNYDHIYFQVGEKHAKKHLTELFDSLHCDMFRFLGHYQIQYLMSVCSAGLGVEEATLIQKNGVYVFIDRVSTLERQIRNYSDAIEKTTELKRKKEEALNAVKEEFREKTGYTGPAEYHLIFTHLQGNKLN